MRQRTSRFYVSVLLVALAGIQLFLAAGTNPAFAQRGCGYGHGGRLPVPRSWVTRWFVQSEFLALWASGNPVPPLLTTSPAGTPQFDAGVLGEPDTTLLVGNERIANGPMLGGRLTFGHWFDDLHTRSIETQMWGLGISQDDGFLVSDGDPIVARPFFNPEIGLQDAQLIAFDPTAFGGIGFNNRAEMYSVDMLYRQTVWRGHYAKLDIAAGYRYLRFRESFEINAVLDQTLELFDDFATANDFHGGEVAAVASWDYGCWLLDVTTKVAVGDMREELNIEGSTSLVADPTINIAGGWLAAPSNIGTYVRHEQAAIPELAVRLIWEATDLIHLNFGYDLIYIPSVLRTGSQINTDVSPSQLAPVLLARGGAPVAPPQPQARLDDNPMWLSGISFGAEVRW